jgi:hypothetical protein
VKMREIKEKSAKQEHAVWVFDLHIVFSSGFLGRNRNHTVVRFMLSLLASGRFQKSDITQQLVVVFYCTIMICDQRRLTRPDCLHSP